MDLATIKKMFEQAAKSDVTKTIHRKPYPALSPSRPELNQAGRVVLVTGGGTGVGYSIARSFVRASATTIFILGRRPDVLSAAASSLEQEATAVGTKTKIVARPCDLSNLTEVETFWEDLTAQGISVDVFVANAAKFTEAKPLLKLGIDEVWSQIEVNAKALMYMAEKFCSQAGEGQRFIVHVTTAAIHATARPSVAQLPAYTLSKTIGTLFLQLLAQDVTPEKTQIVSFHPGLVYNSTMEKMGLPADIFDDDDLCGQYAVWLASEEARFLHGRFTWATWDVDEISTGDIRKRISEDPYFLKSSVVGLNAGMLA